MNSEHGKRMLGYLPDYYAASRVMQVVLEAQGQEIDGIYGALDDIPRQFYVKTATWGLRYWEEACGIPVNEADTIETRRARVLAKLRRYPSARRHDIEQIIAAYMTEPFEIVEHYSEYKFTVKLPVDGIIDAEAAFRNLCHSVEEAKPAHLEFFPTLTAEFENVHDLALSQLLQFAVLATIFTYRELYLDGTFLLDGTYPLAFIVREPDIPNLELLLLGDVSNEITHYGQIALISQLGAEKTEGMATGLWFWNELSKEEAAAVTCRSQHTNSFYISAEWVKINRPLWYLDGIYALDGEKKLDAGLTIEQLN